MPSRLTHRWLHTKHLPRHSPSLQPSYQSPVHHTAPGIARRIMLTLPAHPPSSSACRSNFPSQLTLRLDEYQTATHPGVKETITIGISVSNCIGFIFCRMGPAWVGSCARSILHPQVALRLDECQPHDTSRGEKGYGHHNQHVKLCRIPTCRMSSACVVPCARTILTGAPPSRINALSTAACH